MPAAAKNGTAANLAKKEKPASISSEDDSSSSDEVSSALSFRPVHVVCMCVNTYVLIWILPHENKFWVHLFKKKRSFGDIYHFPYLTQEPAGIKKGGQPSKKDSSSEDESSDEVSSIQHPLVCDFYSGS